MRTLFRGTSLEDRTLDQPRMGIPKWARWGGMLLFGLALIFSAEALARYWTGFPPAQPIPFSHRFHVQTKQISCIFCHPGAMRSQNAGMPPVEKCLLCHQVIAPHFWPIQKIHRYKQQGVPIEWARVNWVPRFVRFSHRAHLAARVDCGRCHGNVRQMDRVEVAHRFDMGFCVDCHKENKASVSCDVCHH